MILKSDLFETEDYVLGVGTLGSLAGRYAKNYFIHPAFLDGAINTGMLCTDETKQAFFNHEKAYLLIFIETFHAVSALKMDECHIVYRKQQTLNTLVDDLIYVSFDLYDKHNCLCASIDRAALKEAMSEKELKVLLSGKNNKERRKTDKNDLAPEGSTERKIQLFLINEISRILDCDADKIDIDEDFFYIGLDSGNILQVVKMIEAVIGGKMYATVFFERSTIKKLANYLSEQYGSKFNP